jgi:hypothetical protein
MEKLSWTDYVTNEELHPVRKGRNILHAMKGRTTNWIGHIWRWKCLLKHVIERSKIRNKEITELRGRRRQQLLMILRKLSDTGNSKRKH